MSRSDFLFPKRITDEEFVTKREEAKRALHEAYQEAEAGNWDKVMELGLSYPQNMDRIILAYYSAMPDKVRYILPVKWYMAGGKASDAVCDAIKNALQYRPIQWIGKGACNGEILDVFCCIKNGSIEEAKDCLSWATNYGTAYVEAMKINGKVFKAHIKKENIIAYDDNTCEPVIQYRGVYAVQQDFPVLPLACLKRKDDLYGTATDPDPEAY